MLKINGLSYSFGRHAPPVLEDVSLELESGEVGILLGKNGSGKTTLFKCVLGLLAPQSGQILLDGRDISGMSRAKRAELAAYVPQNIEFGSLSVFDTVLAARCSRFSVRAGQRDIDKVRRVLADMGIAELSHKNALELSGGERQKTAIARAAAQEPRLLILDEPTGNLDIAAEQLIVREARRMANEKNTAILCSLHDLNEAMDFGDRFFLLKDGKIKYSGGKEVFTPEILKDIFGIEVRIAEIDGQKIIITGGMFSK